MSRFNTSSHRVKPAVATTTSPIATVSKTPDTRTYNGGAGWTRPPQSELFLMATGALQDGKSDFYESGKQRDDRLRQLVATVAVDDIDWFAQFVKWLRNDGNIRAAALMAAADGVKARLDAGLQAPANSVMPTNREIIDSVLQRADEPGELLAYWTQEYGRKIPKPVKRGLADAVRRLYNEYALLKYDTASKGYRFGDVLNLVHAAPDPDKPWQGDLFQYALDRRYGRTSIRCDECNKPARWFVDDDGVRCDDHRAGMDMPLTMAYDNAVPTSLKMTQLNLKYTGWANGIGTPCGAKSHDSGYIIRGGGPEFHEFTSLLDREFIRQAGMTWENVLSMLGDKVDKAKLWEALIPSMGLMAQLKNLRNFDQAGVSDEIAQQVITRLTDPQQIARSRQFPFRFLAAFNAAPSLRWGYPLEQALNYSLANVPHLGGRTLVLVDRSGSMWGPLSARSNLNRADAAAIFGTALALRAADADLVQFGTSSSPIHIRKGESVLKVLERFGSLGGTNTTSAVRQHYRQHDRVVIVTDEQANFSYYGDPTAQVPANVPVYTWNLAGYRTGHGPSGSHARFTFGGLTDSAFRLIPLLEAGTAGVWPWQIKQGD